MQAGATGIVTALHRHNRGEIWPVEEVDKRRDQIDAAGLEWTVVESIGVGEEIKTRSGDFRRRIDNYKQSIRNAARAGVKTICYNFMAITDWTRTDLTWRLPSGGYALRFDAIDFAAYDCSSWSAGGRATTMRPSASPPRGRASRRCPPSADDDLERR